MNTLIDSVFNPSSAADYVLIGYMIVALVVAMVAIFLIRDRFVTRKSGH